MKKDRKNSVINNAGRDQPSPNRQSRRKFLIKTGGVLAAGAFGAGSRGAGAPTVPLHGRQAGAYRAGRALHGDRAGQPQPARYRALGERRRRQRR